MEIYECRNEKILKQKQMDRDDEYRSIEKEKRKISDTRRTKKEREKKKEYKSFSNHHSGTLRKITPYIPLINQLQVSI